MIVGYVDVLVVAELAPPAILLWTATLLPRPRHRRALVLAAAVLAIAVSPPLHAWAHRSATGHMVQHLLFLVVAAPLIAAGMAGAARFVPPTIRRALRTRAALGGAAVLHVATVGLWHLPRPYDAALEVGWLHTLGHITLLVPAVWWWASLAAHSPRRDPFVAAISLMAVATAGAVVGTLLMFADPIYAHGGIVDQQVAGAVMAGTGAVYGAAGLSLVARAIGRLDEPRRHRAREARARYGSTAAVAIAAIAAAAVVGLGASARPTVSASIVGVGDNGVDETSDDAGASNVTGASDVDGELLYLRDCSSCHAPNGEGTARGVDITEVGAASVQYTLTTGRMPISDPHAPVRRSDPVYTPAEIDAIVDHTRRFVTGPEIPSLERSVGVADGGVLYRLHCAACHSATGIGGAQSFGRAAPPILDASPDEVAAVIVAGPSGMPSFLGTLDDDEIAGITEYVAMLQDPPGRGLPIPGGRVGEGLVAWLAGVVALALAAMWIGKRT